MSNLLRARKSTCDLEAEGGSPVCMEGLPAAFSLPPALSTPPSPELAATQARARPVDQQLLVMKFGGTSLAGAECLRRVASIVTERLSRRPVLVLSAMGKTTNDLLAAADRALKKSASDGPVDLTKIRAAHVGVLKELGAPVPADVEELLTDLARILEGISLLREVSNRTRDLVVSFGERLSVRVFAAYFNHLCKTTKMGVAEARALDSWKIGLLTTSGAGSADSAFSQVEVLPEAYASIASNLERLHTSYDYVPVVTGYIAQDAHGVITTLGRDGSDLTASIVGVAVQASEVQIWKDVAGIMTTDPRLVPAARPLEILTFEEASELSTFGAKVVHPAAVLPAWQGRIPMSVLNSTAPEQRGTRIVAELGEKARDGRVAAITCKRGITMITIQSLRMLGQHGFLAHVFETFNRFEASVDVIATSEVTVSLTLDQGYKAVDLDGLKKRLEGVAHVSLTENVAMLTLITAKEDSTNVLKESFTAFEELKVTTEMVSHGASKVNVTFILPDESLLPCIQRLHEVFFER
eukprot:TRINITY_DN71808_c0_g1_i1.p1 TRINITY_DN71808_c0_g1~~TRINITY_DN71808_c0_g1_i1.p1  ORF type:complete len:525 (-),score=98.92 TRINITY_DN71808_c0_g1_i1:130-1704(-)